MIVLSSDLNRVAFRPDRILLVIDGQSITLEEWRTERDLDEWDRRYPDRLSHNRYNV